jgi:hypothetical protein
MWSALSEKRANGRVLKVSINLGSSSVSLSEVLRRWQDDADFRLFFNATLSNAPFSAFRWETPAATVASADRPFEFVLLDSPGLAREPDPHAFAEHFDGATPGEIVVSFANLGKDAILVVPCPIAPSPAYGHLAAFVREAPESQKHQLWRVVGKVMQAALGSAPVWLSTAGGGVSWLHVRLDKKPKYYGYEPYRHAVS